MMNSGCPSAARPRPNRRVFEKRMRRNSAARSDRGALIGRALAASEIALYPPEGQGLFRQIPLSSGTIARPVFALGGRVTVESEADARELELEGWIRQPTAITKRAPIVAKALTAADLAKIGDRAPELAKAFKHAIDRIDDIEAQLSAISAQPLPQLWGQRQP